MKPLKKRMNQNITEFIKKLKFEHFNNLRSNEFYDVNYRSNIEIFGCI